MEIYFSLADKISIGPYAWLYNFNIENEVTVFKDGLLTNSFTVESRLGFYGLGFQAGYQFVFKEKVSLDLLLFGPSMVNYRLRAKFDGELTLDEENEQLQKYLDFIGNASCCGHLCKRC